MTEPSFSPACLLKITEYNSLSLTILLNSNSVWSHSPVLEKLLLDLIPLLYFSAIHISNTNSNIPWNLLLISSALKLCSRLSKYVQLCGRHALHCIFAILHSGTKSYPCSTLWVCKQDLTQQDNSAKRCVIYLRTGSSWIYS